MSGIGGGVGRKPGIHLDSQRRTLDRKDVASLRALKKRLISTTPPPTVTAQRIQTLAHARPWIMLVKSAEVECSGTLGLGVQQPPIRAFMDDLTVKVTSILGCRWMDLQRNRASHQSGPNGLQANQVQVLGCEEREGHRAVPLFTLRHPKLPFSSLKEEFRVTRARELVK